MVTPQECLACCDRLIDLMNLELTSMSEMLRGELYDSYVVVVEDEIEELRSIRQELQTL